MEMSNSAYNDQKSLVTLLVYGVSRDNEKLSGRRISVAEFPHHTSVYNGKAWAQILTCYSPAAEVSSLDGCEDYLCC